MMITIRRAVAAAVVAASAVAPVVPFTTARAARPTAASPAASPAAAVSSITLDGHGYGHGIGLSQWGALGYAVNFGWSAGQILDHYYGGTVASTAPNTLITIRLTALDGAQTAVVHDNGQLVIDGQPPTPYRSLVARETTEGHYEVWGRTDASVCPGAADNLDDPAAGWTVVIPDQVGSVTIRPSTDTSASADYGDLVGLCEPTSGRVRYYRGAIRAINSSAGANRTVNEVQLEQYLRSVVGGEVSYGWATLGGGKGVQALQAQAIAARSYGLAENKETYAKTCDNNCQTYRGAAYRTGVGGPFVPQEFGPTDAAVQATAGVVRRYGSDAGAVAYAMFSASSGGYTATNTLGFTPVVDDGDAVAGNSGHTWTASITTAAIEAAYPTIGAYAGITVNSRDGNGDWGGRVLTMTVTGTAGSVSVTGAAFRSTFALKSNWFQIRDAGAAGAPPPPDQCVGRTDTAVPGTVANSAAASFVALAPTRLIDTRFGTGTDAEPLGGNCTLEVDPHAPVGATAVVVNVTAVAPAVNGYLTAYPCGADKPLASIVPIVAGRIVPGTAIVPLDDAGTFCIFASTTTDLVVDLSGAYVVNGGQKFQPIVAQRRYDSRNGAILPAGSTVRVPIAGSFGIPATATAVAVTVHSTNAVTDGFITIWPCGATRPTTSVLNTSRGAAVTNHVQVGLDPSGALCMYNQTSMHLVLDVSGWFGPTATTLFHAVTPYRLLDTRVNNGLAGAFSAGQNRAIRVTGAGGVPASGVAAIAAEVTSVGATSAGYITVHPCLTPIPTISMVRNLANTIAATTVTGIVDSAGRWCLQTSVAMHALIDVSGWYG